MEGSLSAIKTKITAIEAELETLSETRAEVTSIRSALADQVTATASLLSRSNDLENRSRRCNLLFRVITDVQGESWAISEQKVLKCAEENLGITLQTSDIERAHKIGTFQEGKTDP